MRVEYTFVHDLLLVSLGFSLLILTFPSSCPMCVHGYLETLPPLLCQHQGVVAGYFQNMDGFLIRKWRYTRGEAE